MTPVSTQRPSGGIDQIGARIISGRPHNRGGILAPLLSLGMHNSHFITRGQGGQGGRQTGSSGQSPIVRAESAAEGAQLHLTGSDDR